MILALTGRLRDGSLVNSSIISFSTTTLADTKGLRIPIAFALARMPASRETFFSDLQVCGILVMNVVAFIWDTQARQNVGLLCLLHRQAVDPLFTRLT